MGNRKIGYINPDNGLITTYARAIEARFDLTRFDNNITNILKDTKPDQISQLTKDFVKSLCDGKINGFLRLYFLRII